MSISARRFPSAIKPGKEVCALTCIKNRGEGESLRERQALVIRQRVQNVRHHVVQMLQLVLQSLQHKLNP